MKETGVDADRACVRGIETEQQQVSPEQQQQRHNGGADPPGLADICRRDAQNVSEQHVGEINVAAGLRDQNQSERKKACEDQADHRVFLDPRFLLHKADGRHRADTKHERTEGKRQAEGVSQHDARQHGMGHRISHQGPALEGHVTGEQSTDTTHECANQQRTHHEVMAQRFQQQLQQVRDLSSPPLSQQITRSRGIHRRSSKHNEPSDHCGWPRSRSGGTPPKASDRFSGVNTSEVSP